MKPRVLAAMIDLEDVTASLDFAYSVAAYFELKSKDAQVVAREVGKAVSTWRKEAARLGTAKAEVERTRGVVQEFSPSLRTNRRRKAARFSDILVLG